MADNLEVEDEVFENYPYQLIEFIVRGPRSGHRSVDMIPSTWIVFNRKNMRLETKFPPPPYTEETTQFLRHLVQNKLPPVDSWSSYSVKLIGQAKTYEEGESKIKQVKNDGSLLYTEDSDFNAQEKAVYLTKKYKEIKKQSTLPKLPNFEEQESSSSSTRSNSSFEKKELKKLIKSKNIKSKTIKVKKNSQKKIKDPKEPIIKAIEKKQPSVHQEQKKEIKFHNNENLSQNPKKLEKSIQPLPNVSNVNTDFEIVLDELCTNIWSTRQSNLNEGLVKAVQDSTLFHASSADNNEHSKLVENESRLVNDYPKVVSSDESHLDKIIKDCAQFCSSSADNNAHHSKEVGNESRLLNDHSKIVSTDVIRMDEIIIQDTMTHETEGNVKLSHFYNPDTEMQASNLEDDNNNQYVKNRNKKTKQRLQKVKEIEHISADSSLILAALKGLSVQINDLSNKFDCQMKTIQSIALKTGINSSGSFIINNNLDLPFKDIESFKNFNDKLEDSAFCDDFMSSLTSLIDFEHVISKSALNIVKKYLSKDLACQFTNIRKSGSKFILKEFKFHQCIVDVLTRTHTSKDGSKTSIEKKAIDAIGSTLAYARDWDGGRKERDDKNV